jgi:hypothetical protein
MRTQSSSLIILVTLWTAALAAGFWWLSVYENKPGIGAVSPSHWPASSKLVLKSRMHTLVMLAHPQCPCTRASIGELARVMARRPGKLGAYVLFLNPRGFNPEWVKTDLWFSAAAIPGVTVLLDPDGEAAKVFGATTSGQTLVYEPSGRLVFAGGLTGSRGHMGDNLGEDAVVKIVDGQENSVKRTEVFGCPLVAGTQRTAMGR